MTRIITTIAVDLTPVLPGGENGGAKIFVLELVRLLAIKHPEVNFLLLTHCRSHTELATLDRNNVERLPVLGNEAMGTVRTRLQGIANRLLPYLPLKIRKIAGMVGREMNTAFKRSFSSGLLSDRNISLLFCPFTATTYFEPGIPTVCTIYDLQYKTYPQFFSTLDVLNRDRTFLEACQRASALAAISDYSRESAVVHGKIDPSRIRTIQLRMAQRMTSHDGDDQSVLGRLTLKAQRYFIYAANFWKHKNHEMLLTAFGMACNHGLPPDIKLVCTGSPGERQDWLLKAVSAMNLSERVIFPGYIPNEELNVLLKNSAALIFPSLYEGFGLPVIEAMSAGVPVACSNTTSLPEVAADAAILFDPRVPGDISKAMLSLAADRELRANLVEAGHRRASAFSDSDRMADEYWNMFSYAFHNERLDDFLQGAYPDGWASPKLSIQVAPGNGALSLDLELSAPEWLPEQRLIAQAYCGKMTHGDPVELTRGSDAVMSIPLKNSRGIFEVRISPAFVPSMTGLGDDHRELAAVLKACRIIRADGSHTQLYPETTPK
jgi:glycosyltransferase involved in cell wall biosynthesis